MDAEAFAVSSVVTFSMYDLIGRARPLYADCQSDHSGVGCNMSPTASFPSGHAANAFTSAGVSCANHSFLPIYGSRLGDALACARDVTLATTDGVLRIMGDRHYATDVIAGSIVGFGFGYGLPMLLHRRVSRAPSAGSWTLAPMTGERSGLVLAGTF
jgi:membrane-associated phospholipid phosphatase